jgi:anti-sigma B factor antagonist
MELELSDSDVNGWTVVAASGEIDVAAAPALRDRVTELISSGSTHLVIDLEDVDFIDSTGLGVLVGAVRRARTEGGDLRLVCTDSRLLRVFDVTGLGEVFSIEASVEDATALASGQN